MKSVTINRNSWAFWLARKWGDLPTYWYEDTILDICKFRRHVIFGFLKLLFIVAGVTGLTLGFSLLEYHFVVGTYKYYFTVVSGTYPEVLGKLGFAGLILNLTALFSTIAGLIIYGFVLYNNYKHEHRWDTPKKEPKPPGIVKEMYLSWKQKLCYTVVIPPEQ